MNQPNQPKPPIRNFDEFPEHLRKRITSYGITHKQWSGVLILSCGYPYCLVESEDPYFMIRHSQEHGIHPETEPEPAAAPDEEILFEGEKQHIPATPIGNAETDEERND